MKNLQPNTAENRASLCFASIDTTLFRPVGLHELGLIWDSGMREFSPRLPSQPIFYPVLNIEYARQIARDWNTKDKNSVFSGFVTSLEIDSEFLSKYDTHSVGAKSHMEYWIPAAELPEFNKAIQNGISVREGFFGEGFTGQVPTDFLLKGKDATAQFADLFKLWDYSSFDVSCEVSANRKTVFLNCLFWSQHDFSELGISNAQRESALGHLKAIWEFHGIKILYRLLTCLHARCPLLISRFRGCSISTRGRTSKNTGARLTARPGVFLPYLKLTANNSPRQSAATVAFLLTTALMSSPSPFATPPPYAGSAL
jgi:hypothetical protein